MVEGQGEWNLVRHEEWHGLVQGWGLISGAGIKVKFGDMEKNLKSTLGLQKAGHVVYFNFYT